ncbi:AAA family ATPase [Neorhizobium tomejilense]|uniref:AAA family ATPase n=1 Tax=Neorhizobium tomejilense TaxID=2093828 RepID=UPI000CF8FACD|nr:hypothetical protein [Neorhizobium tomejilense]
MKFLIIIGFSGVGKTSAGAFLSTQAGAVHFEASKYMRSLWSKSEDRSETIQDFAAKSLKTRPNAVPDAILREVDQSRATRGIITGFRSPAEVRRIEATHDIRLLLIDATLASRIDRLRHRVREGDPVTCEQLMKLDEAHLAMGMRTLLEVGKPGRISNERGVQDFQRSLIKYASSFFMEKPSATPRQSGSRVGEPITF